jgi:Ca2+-binding EF-hand superfamily protein
LVPQQKVVQNKLQQPKQLRSAGAADGTQLVVYPQPTRPSSARTRVSSTATPLFSPDVRPHLKGPTVMRPGSAPEKAGGDGRLRSEIFALRSPGEYSLPAPQVTPRSPAARQANQQLQFELGLTASVLRAAQNRLVQEREQRQIARIGEERALMAMKRARDEALHIEQEKVAEELHLAKAMHEQRLALEAELSRLENEQDVMQSQMQAEINAKEDALQAALDKIVRLEAELEVVNAKLSAATQSNEQLLAQKNAQAEAFKEERRGFVERVRALENELKHEKEERVRERELAEDMRLADVSRGVDSMRSEAERLLEEEREKRVAHLQAVGVRRLLQKGLARGWSAWLEAHQEKQRRLRMLKAAGARLLRPRLVAGYQHWQSSWKSEQAKKANMTVEQRLAEYEMLCKGMQAELEKTKADLSETRRILEASEAEKFQMNASEAEKGAAEKEKRVEHQCQMAIRRLAKRELSRGWDTWQPMFIEHRRRKRLLQAASAKLTKPHLSACYANWKRDWEEERRVMATMPLTERLAAETEKRQKAEAELHDVRAELAKLRDEALTGNAQEAELQRRMKEKQEEEKEQRVAYLQQRALRRIGNQDIMRGWSAWQEQYLEKRRQLRVLAQAGMKLARPKLVASYVQWRTEWKVEQQILAKKSTKERLADEVQRREQLQVELERVKEELSLARKSSLMQGMSEKERQRQLEEEAAKEREKRIEHLSQMAARRMGKKEISMGFGAWAEMYYERQRQKRLLAVAGSKLAKPALSASYALWRAAWQDEQKQEASMTASEKIAAERAKHEVTLAELTKVRDELARAREAALNGTAREEELARQRAEEAEREKEKRVEHLSQMAARRLGKREIAMGFQTWSEMYYEAQRQKRVLAAAGAKIAKPKMAAGYTHWKHDWEFETQRNKTKSQKEIFAEERRALEAEVSKLRYELEKVRQAALDGTAREEELARQRAEQAAYEKEKRVEHLSQMAARRMGKKEIAMGFGAWAEMYYERQRQKRLLTAAGARLSKPKLAAGYAQWKRDWDDEMIASAQMTVSEQLAVELKKNAANDVEIAKLRAELARAREAAINGTAREEELARQRQEQAAFDKEKRVEHLTQMAARRMGKKEISRGFEAWSEMCYEAQRQKRLLAAAGSKLAKPALSAGYAHWKRDWQMEMTLVSKMSHKERLEAEQAKLANAEATISKLQVELSKAREAALNGTALENERRRQAEEQAAYEKEKRVEHLSQMAARRMGKKEISMGFEAWAEMYYERQRQKRLLTAAGARLSKPKLAASYAQWKRDWEDEMKTAASMTLQERFDAQEKRIHEKDEELAKLRDEVARAREAALNGTALDNERRRQAEEAAEREKEKRVEHLSQMAARRLGKKEIAMGFSTWSEMYYEAQRRKRLLLAAGAKIMKPKLVAGYTHWRMDWQSQMRADARLTDKQRLASEKARADLAEVNLRKATEALEALREAMESGNGREELLRQRAEQELAAEREKRIEHLSQMAARRMGKKEISMGFEAWAEMHYERQRQKRLLIAAGARLSKPKLAAGYAHWRADWQMEMRANSKMTMQEKLEAEKKKLEDALAEAAKLRIELGKARQAALSGTAKEDEMRRQMEERQAMEKEQRVQHLTQMAVRRMGKKEISRGFEAWADMYFELVRRKRLLAAAGSKLAKPKLSGSYSLWKKDWEDQVVSKTFDAQEEMMKHQAEVAAENRKKIAEQEQELVKLRKELARAREAALNGTALEDERRRQVEEQAAYEKEKRVEHLTQMAVRRLGKKGIAMAWESWAEAYYERLRQKRLLAAAGSKLAKPHLSSAYTQWKHDWEDEKQVSATMTLKQRLDLEQSNLAAVNAKLAKVEAELARAREAALNGTALENERRRQAEEAAEREKEKRVEHLSQMAARRMGKKEIAMGFSTWVDQYEREQRNKRLLLVAGAKLAKPKLSAGYAQWRQDWEAEIKAVATMTYKEQLDSMATKLANTEADLAQARVELKRARDAALNGTAREDEIRRQMEEKAEAAKQQRVEHLSQMAARRFGKKEIARGFETWADLCMEMQRRKRLLLAASIRLTKPKLAAGYAHWRADWFEEVGRLQSMTQAERLAEEAAKAEAQRKKYLESEAELSKVRAELSKLREAVANGDALEVERQRQREEQAINEREKRVEHLTQMAVRRLGKKGIAMAWESWAEAYFEGARCKRLLTAAAVKLAKPRLSGGYTQWKLDWEHEMKMQKKMTLKERFDQKEAQLNAANAELSRLRIEFERARQAALNGTAKEDELRRQMEEKAALEKEKRVEHLTQMAARRMGKKEISRGFGAWSEMCYEAQRQKRLLKAASSRLTKPALSAGYALWKSDWETEVAALKHMSQGEQLAIQISRAEAAEAEARRAREEMNRKLATAQRERDELIARLSELDGGLAARELEMARQLEEEKEKRIAHLQRMAARRIMQKDLSRGMSAWIDMWESKRRNERLLRAASSRLAKPKLAASYGHWSQDWAVEQAKKRTSAKAAVAQMASGSAVDAELKAMKQELEAARAAAARAGGAEEEYRQLALEEAAKEREKRVEHLTQMAVRRLGKKELSMGWQTWSEVYLEDLRRKRLLRAAASRLAKPKLSAGYLQWKHDWEAEMLAQSKMTLVEKYKAEKTKAEKYKAELEKTAAELLKAREAALNGNAKEDEMRRQLAEKEAAEKQKRIEHITQMAVKRLGKKEISRGWTTWSEKYYAEARNKRLLAAAASRLTKPRLVFMYTHWRKDWEMEAVQLSQNTHKHHAKHAKAKAELAEAEAKKLKLDMEKKLKTALAERDELLAKLSLFDGGTAKSELELKRQLEEEKEKRIAHLQRMAARRIMQKDLSRGMSAWIDMWSTKKRQQRLLLAAAARLAKPKVVSAYMHWRVDWKTSTLNKTSRVLGTAEQQAAELAARNRALEAELSHFRVELARLRESTATGESDLARAQAARAVAEKEARVEHLTQVAARRLGRKDMARGWTAWSDAYLLRARQKRLLANAALRLSKPKLVHSFMDWKHEWELDHVMKFKMTHKERFEIERRNRESVEGKLYKVEVESVQKQEELKKALEDARAASLEHLRQLKEALRQIAFEKDASATMKVRADEALETEKLAKAAEEQMKKQMREQADEAERRLAKLLADQRRQLELEAAAIRTELETQLEALRSRLSKAQAAASQASSYRMKSPESSRGPVTGEKSSLRSVQLMYDPNKSVVDQLREGLKKNNTRVLDLFRDMGGDDDGKISKKDFRDAFAIMGPDFPPQVVDNTFDYFDPDKSGYIEFQEFDKFLRRAASIMNAGAASGPSLDGPKPPPKVQVPSKGNGMGMGKLKAAGAAAKLLSKTSPLGSIATRAATPEVDPTDLEGAGRGDFQSNMKIRVDDFMKADSDGNTELDFDEFRSMRIERCAKDGLPEPTEKELKDLFYRLDLDDSGTVDLSEYVQYALREALKESKGRVLDLFQEWDKDKSGFIDREEFAMAMQRMNFKCSQADILKIFSDLDPDGTGQLDYRELNQSLRRSLRKKPKMAAETDAKKKPSPGVRR